ncbi:ApbE family lipoprotein [Dinoroseobacter shibae DFL 12 = DSM 16493]|jgi:thiamine biosynthesis lipoprotein|uniref:FAD:protein FMN transferase n=1 Tax=Dinoroseobacter shibae (strain DSM 16493 / NCIMB 14021 / DFL 12) TaxID=398580 RepID=A8LQE5_DINSH|nr:FAD:protein FMN transferase [Dinoroseobacter shibae]ABV92431.1 ApbE family lipoprotein [Dinoroseobacter shibae DFL 12 = DSM 16493]URF47376.1 FAD:protein FMN transferase [Dinoroseobacter shibae]URF51687.1 FAD:protein FMN transferase [Dinoroseobacter shibae]
MNLHRRRFLSISAAAMAAGPVAAAGAGFTRWRGEALGAECEITLHAPPGKAQPALDAARAALRAVETQFNLYDPTSALARLNATGRLEAPEPMFLALMELSRQMYEATEGRFDPSIQPLWSALARGLDPETAQAQVGWSRVRWDAGAVRLAPGQALSFNGVGQGFATDRVAETLAAHGMGRLLVNIGEFRGAGGPWRVGLSDPAHGLVGTRQITDGAIATSSPRALSLGGTAHILDPLGRRVPRWSTVSVEAETATVADALSTALCLMRREEIGAVQARVPALRRVTLIDHAGDLVTL